jgi:small nuclear ribonucleoprotein (snRNP)-like protein
MKKAIVFFLLVLFSVSSVFSQVEVNKKVTVTMNNGEEFQGQLVSQDTEAIVLITENGEIKLNAKNVKSIKEDDNTSKFLFANPNDMRYFIGNSGIPLKKGKGYYQNILVLFHSAHYGITNNLSIGGGLEFLSTIQGQPIWYLTPKLAFNVSPNFHVGGGAIIMGLAGEGTASFLYGTTTFGKSETNISTGIGYGLFDGEFSKYPSITISGTHRVSNSLALVTENYIFPNDLGDPLYFGIHGIRLLSRKNSFDIGAIVIPQIAEFIRALPYISYVRVF